MSGPNVVSAQNQNSSLTIITGVFNLYENGKSSSEVLLKALKTVHITLTYVKEDIP